MESMILEKARKLNWVLQEAPNGRFSFDEICEVFSELMDSNVYIADNTGRILGVHYAVEEDKTILRDEEKGIDSFPESYGREMSKLRETRANLQNEEVLEILEQEKRTCVKYHTIIPILGGGERWGTLILTRYEPAYTDEDLALAEIGATTVGLEIQRVKNLEDEAECREKEVVKMALSTLSYSENEAVKKIFEALDGDEGILIASKVADEYGITRSVIVNALRKLESAGVIESKSLGMKGTHIRVRNRKFYEEIS
jgi:transcriptional pleiotropic repressor